MGSITSPQIYSVGDSISIEFTEVYPEKSRGRLIINYMLFAGFNALGTHRMRTTELLGVAFAL
jgi:hypothetical protein